MNSAYGDARWLSVFLATGMNCLSQLRVFTSLGFVDGLDAGVIIP